MSLKTQKEKKNDRSGKQAEYVRVGGLTRTIYRCSCHGLEFETRPILSMHVRQYRARLKKDFAGIVKDGNLGQPAWDRLPGETALLYGRFRIYLTMPNRSLRGAAAIMGYDVRKIERTSSNWSWRIRAELWDAKVAADALVEFERQKRGSAIKQAKLGRRLQDVALAGAQKLLQNEERLDEMSGNEIAKLADVGSKIERLANSDPTSITDDRGQVRLVWEGPRPSWAPSSPEPRTIQGELTTKVLEASNG